MRVRVYKHTEFWSYDEEFKLLNLLFLGGWFFGWRFWSGFGWCLSGFGWCFACFCLGSFG
jgi:hypothetical protein